VAEIRGSTDVSWAAVSCAVGLVTARRTRSGDSQAAILGDRAPGEVVAALEIIVAGLLEVMSPEDGGAAVLKDLGLLALAEGAGQSGGPV
jgi:hypothetical protein